MNLIGRQDRVLLIGFAVALLVIFARPVRALLDIASQVEHEYGLSLVPALVILTGVFIDHQQTKRQEAKAQLLAAEAGEQLARDRATEMERLVTFGQALGRSLDLDAIREVVAQ